MLIQQPCSERLATEQEEHVVAVIVRSLASAGGSVCCVEVLTGPAPVGSATLSVVLACRVQVG